MKRICTLLAICIISISLSGCGHPIVNIENARINPQNDGSQKSLKVVQDAILRACNSKGWRANVKKDNVIEAEIRRGRHMAAIEIPFSQKSYSIIYKDSQGLLKGRRKIHKRYNGWVGFLSESINRELGQLPRIY